MTTRLTLTHPADTLKMVRETLCAAQNALPQTSHHGQRITRIISEIDRQRPLDTDGKHGTLHTDSCGCDDNPTSHPTRTHTGHTLTLTIEDGCDPAPHIKCHHPGPQCDAAIALNNTTIWECYTGPTIHLHDGMEIQPQYNSVTEHWEWGKH